MKLAILVIGIVIIGALFVIQDFGSQTISDPVQKQPASQPSQSQTVQQNQPTSSPTQKQEIQAQNQCDSSYPGVCIPPYPPDLDCGEIAYSNFRVIQPDPHGFDGDKAGISCDVGAPSEPVSSTQESNCDSSYPDVCIAQYPPDLDCGEISHKNFKVLAPDPHGFDGDNDGIGCES